MIYNGNEKALIWYNHAQGINTFKRKDLLDEFSDAEELFNRFYEEKELIISILGESAYEKLASLHDTTLIDKIIDEMTRKSVRAVTYGNAHYPSRLKHIPDPPMCLYCLGDIGLFTEERIISIVGTRRLTRYGKDACKMFTRELCANGFTITSGLARGADTAAHVTALESGGKTIAVLGNGLDKVYPSENLELYRDIARKGLIITEYPLGTQPFSYNFPLRNRIISGISDALLVVEAGEKSGTMITVDYALDHGKDVFAVPGNIFNDQSKGTNELIKMCNADMVTNINDILLKFDIKPRNINASAIQLDFIEVGIINELDSGDVHFEELLIKSGLEAHKLISILTNLEMYGLIRKLPGNYYGKVQGV